jgi:D-lactate dehydrogenase (cytochrome)
VRLAELRRILAAEGLYYPPIPTYDGAFVGATIATNAAGAATFKYGTRVRGWIPSTSSSPMARTSRSSAASSPAG